MNTHIYDFKSVEDKWQKKWDESKLFHSFAINDAPKFYALVEFPYPSGEGLHLGHAFTNTILDILARKKRMSGFNVLYPMGWDAFGLPTENYAIKTGIQPSVATKTNTDRFKAQMKKLALAYNWDAEINTTDPDYYKWTQWIFIKLFEKGLAYKSEAPVGWCPSCKIILANEEIVDGKCERCGTETEPRSQKQWILKITEYADRLSDELDLVDYPSSAKQSQRSWIGKSEGATVKFKLDKTVGEFDSIDVFTTRVDTIFGVSFIALSPEHNISNLLSKNNIDVKKYVLSSLKKSELTRKESRDKTGINTGLFAINPVSGEKVPVWISDFVLNNYGTGAVMGVPAHDDRDHDFAIKHDLLIKEVVVNNKLINSDKYTGLDSDKAKEQVLIDFSESIKKQTTYHLRDWIFSRQHYWGEPIPMVECPKCGTVPVPYDQLPLELPRVDRYQPTETGESPLANITDWVNTKCPKCGEKAKRETDTMPNWAGSSWYYLRYCDPKNNKEIASKEKLNYWLPVDLYLGGAEHTTLHLLYSRFWHKFLNDIDVAPNKEPYMARRQHGIILAEDGTKMSKSKGNVINPDDMINKYGCDTLRTYLAFMGPYDQTMPWSMKGIEGSKRFVNRIWSIYQNDSKFGKETTDKLSKVLNKTIVKVGKDIDLLKHNTAVASLMIFLNEWEKDGSVLSEKDFKKFLIVLSPITPHISEEMWSRFGSNESVHLQKWPHANEEAEDNFTISIMVNGKLRSTLEIQGDTSQDQKAIENMAKKDEKVSKYLDGVEIKKVIYVQNKALNFVI